MEEIIFIVEEAEEGGYIAKALGDSIFTGATDMPLLRQNVKDAVLCHFDEANTPKLIRLHFFKEELIQIKS